MWTEINNKLTAEFTFEDFVQAWAFMTEVAMLAERKNHHPEWTNVWNKVAISLSTHDAGDVVTEKDRKLADGISKIYERYQYRT
ncbi:MAG: 4a-hydroxytetrahydrobiopterin dehydratase [Saprospiraceae bacterium]|uniref:4a-hydroxytetrahydrobiopterin dehydratase n=1 Tax=Candidatus Opimibacter skivensis TaxID=2982028 RepID=A0A9D7XNE4_9BACT|nr:4a-hydroxytetrahydrobiopterin dehydratase [Candidatus Opimibacter skivensis]